MAFDQQLVAAPEAKGAVHVEAELLLQGRQGQHGMEAEHHHGGLQAPLVDQGAPEGQMGGQVEGGQLHLGVGGHRGQGGGQVPGGGLGRRRQSPAGLVEADVGQGADQPQPLGQPGPQGGKPVGCRPIGGAWVEGLQVIAGLLQQGQQLGIFGQGVEQGRERGQQGLPAAGLGQGLEGGQLQGQGFGLQLQLLLEQRGGLLGLTEPPQAAGRGPGDAAVVGIVNAGLTPEMEGLLPGAEVFGVAGGLDGIGGVGGLGHRSVQGCEGHRQGGAVEG